MRFRGEGGAQNLTVQFRADSGYCETSIAALPAERTDVRIPFTDFHEPPWSEQNRTFDVVRVTEFSLYIGGTEGGSYEIADSRLFADTE